MRTALYIRVSSRDQVQRGISIPDQVARLRADANAAGETVVAEFIDQARSGASAAKRPAFQQLLAAARRGEFQRVRVESVDRGHRNDNERRSFESELALLGIQVTYSGEPERQAPSQRKLQRGIRGVLAEWESDETSQRTYKRHLHRAKQGRWRGGPYPYGLIPDGQGWFEPDPESYDALLWLLERRAEGMGYHRIAKHLNDGISLNNEPPATPLTAGMLAYQRKPYIEHQDPETGDVIQEPREPPNGDWKPLMVRRICEQAVDGVYAGVYRWGRRYNRFNEDADGNPKTPVRVETGKLLVPEELLRRVQAVEWAAANGTPQMMAERNHFLLDLECGMCGGSLAGYTSTKIKKSGRRYRYRKYRCSGRVNRPGACKMPMLNADTLEQVVLEAVFQSAQERSPDQLLARVQRAIEQRRAELINAAQGLERSLIDQQRRRDEALDAITDRSLSPVLRQALLVRAEEAVRAYEELLAQRSTLRAGLEALDEQARTVKLTLDDPFLDLDRRQEPLVFQSLKRALHLLVHKAILMQHSPQEYFIRLWLYDAEKGVGREIGTNESAWESNPPAKLVTPPTGFEDQDSHRATSALVADCSPGRSRCQIVRYINLPSGPRSRFKSSSVSPKTSFSSSMRSSRRINARPSRSISSSLTVPCSTLCSAWRSIN
jgi:DNA invertase Pin-like site-specific DNA recombinase